MTTSIHCLTLPCKPRNLSLATNPSLSSRLKLATFRPLSFSSNLLSHSLCSKGWLSMNTIERPIRQSVVCMARRYGAKTRKRKIQSRRKGGDREKKKKRRRKAARKNKDDFKIVWLVSAAGTGYVYAKRKGKKSEKLEIRNMTLMSSIMFSLKNRNEILNVEVPNTGHGKLVELFVDY